MFVSLDLDGELSRFERAVLARHLRTCEWCAADAQTIIELTERLRAVPLEPIPTPIVVMRPRRRVGRVVQSAIAAVAVAVVGVWFGVSSSGRAPERGPAVTPSPSGAAMASSDGRSDWPAGLPRSPQVIKLVPGGLYTSGTAF